MKDTTTREHYINSLFFEGIDESLLHDGCLDKRTFLIAIVQGFAKNGINFVHCVVWNALSAQGEYRKHLIEDQNAPSSQSGSNNVLELPSNFIHHHSFIQESICKAPTFDRECVLGVLGSLNDVTNLPSSVVNAVIARDEFDEGLFQYMVSQTKTEQRAVELLEKIKKVRDIPLDWWFSIYRQYYKLWENRSQIKISSTLRTYVVREVNESYPNLPEAWVKKMLDSLSKVGS